MAAKAAESLLHCGPRLGTDALRSRYVGSFRSARLSPAALTWLRLHWCDRGSIR